MTHRNESTHQYTFDVLGRQTKDAVTITNPNVDNRVLALATGYDTGGRPYLFTSYNSATATDPAANQVNQVQRTFNGLYQLTGETQTHGNSQVTGYTVNYTYSFVQGVSEPNNDRPTKIAYPNGRIVRYEYNSGLDASISRLSFLADDNGGSIGTHLEEYSYLGLNTVVKRAHPEPNVDLNYINAPGGSSDAGDQYTGLDRFGRVLNQYWSQAGAGTDSFQYTYDRASNRLTRNNLLRTMLHDFDETYTYDNFNQLSYFTRNTHSQDWRQGLDNLGNWKAFTTDGGTAQNRVHNTQNQITSIDSGLVTPTYDANGNTTRDERNTAYSFDAWNRLAQATTPSSGTAAYSYDALNRRIVENRGSPATDLYYSSQWQVLEERQNGAMQTQNAWSPIYVDAMVLRDSNSGQRLYVQQDANWNVTAIVGKPATTWVVQERYVYDPYGNPSFLNASWVPQSGSSFNWIYLNQSGRYDITSALYYFRNRDLSPTLGRWLQEDPIGYSAGSANLYLFASNSPVNATDPEGLESQGPLSAKDYEKCWEYLGKKILYKLLDQVKWGDGVKEILDQLGCFLAETTGDKVKKCIKLLCKLAPVPPCKLFEVGKFLEACLCVGVVELTKALIPNTMERLVKGWEGVDCADTTFKEACRKCCLTQFGDNPNKALRCLDQAKCDKKPSRF